MSINIKMAETRESTEKKSLTYQKLHVDMYALEYETLTALLRPKIWFIYHRGACGATPSTPRAAVGFQRRAGAQSAGG